MTKEQEKHLAQIVEAVTLRILAKYRRGQAEHGGNLWDRPSLPELHQEITDLNTYVITLDYQLRVCDEKLARAVQILSAAVDDKSFQVGLRLVKEVWTDLHRQLA